MVCGLIRRSVLLGLVVVVAAAAEEHEENEHPKVQSLSSDLRYDDNNRLDSHYIVYEANEACSSYAGNGMINGQDPFGFFPMVSVEAGTEARDKLFGGHYHPDDTTCKATCLERGVQRSLVGDIMPQNYFNPNKSNFVDWFVATCKQVEVCFINYYNKDTPLVSYWIDEDPNTGERQRSEHLTMQYGEQKTQCFDTFIGHQFEIDDEQDGTIVSFTVEFTTVIAFGESPPSDSRKDTKAFDKEIKSTLKHEWTRHNRITRTFSPLGFKKGKLPPDVFASMGAFYYNNRYNIVREEWTGRGVFVNWWETDVFFLQVPWKLKSIYQKRLKDLVEAWAGIPIRETVMYGLRQYTEGARLLTHVDRHETHAVSLIVNVAQGNLTEPWPVEVQDHQDRLHEVTMEPGDIVYYESAKCLHARNRPMMGNGAYYVNLFTHYAPVNVPQWWIQPNPAGTPEAVLETEGTCQLKPAGTTKHGGGSLGLVSTIQCDDARLGSFVSPSLFRATDPQHLIDWWEYTSPRFPDATLKQGASTTDSVHHEQETGKEEL